MGRMILLLVTLLAATAVQAGSPIDGSWKFVKMRYHDQLMDPPNPDLNIFFEFFDDGTDRLSWWRVGEPGFCERRGAFTAGAALFIDLITWVNPANNSDCSRDPDMWSGRETSSVYRRRAQFLEIDANLGNESLTYIWEKQTAKKSPGPFRR